MVGERQKFLIVFGRVIVVIVMMDVPVNDAFFLA